MGEERILLRMKKNFIVYLLMALTVFSCQNLEQKPKGEVRSIQFNIEPIDIQPKPTKTLEAWSYNNTVPGVTIVGNVGEQLIVEGKNNLDRTTTIHWHGISPIPVSEDGPFKPIAAGENFRFEFPLSKPGTYWYHSHTRPVVEQVNRGLYGPFIIKAAEDNQYDGDHIIMLSDMMLGNDKTWQPGLGIGMMERIGNTIAVNGLVDEAIKPMNIKPGEIHKLRFIGAGTAAYFRVKSPFPLRITHTDGQPVETPYIIQEFILGPGERYDAELMIDKVSQGELDLEIIDSIYAPITSYQVFSKIPVSAQGEVQTGRKPIFQGAQKEDVSAWLNKEPDYVLSLTSSMGGQMRKQAEKNIPAEARSTSHMDHSAHGAHGEMMGSQTSTPRTGPALRWFINGQRYPNVPPINAKKNEFVKIRFINEDAHPMDHPMHLHGASFRVLSINGKAPELGGSLDKDVINVPKNGGVVDILVKLEEPGSWMLHCHILDHEDGGMMMHVDVS